LILSIPLEYYPNQYSYGTGKIYGINISRKSFNRFLPPDTS
jgi:hypothetical protein